MRGALAAVTAATVAAGVALVPGYVGVRPWIVASSVVVGLVAVGILLASLARRPRQCLEPVGRARAGRGGHAPRLVLGFVGGRGGDTQPLRLPLRAGDGQPLTQEAAASFPSEVAALQKFVAPIPQSEAADVFETSGVTGYYIMATGREFLPVGGFSGRVPAPSLAEFARLVAEGRIVRVTVTTRPLTRAPDLRWVAAHCTRTLVSHFDELEQATKTVFECTHVAHPRTRQVSLAGVAGGSAVAAGGAAARAPAVAAVANGAAGS